MNIRTRAQQAGMTLIELMIVVAILGIIISIAVPSYQDSVRKSRRADGMALLNQILQAQERFYINNMTYTTDLTDLGYSVSTGVSSEEEHYKVSVAACGTGIAQCVNLIAKGQDDQAKDDDLEINSQGLRKGPWD